MATKRRRAGLDVLAIKRALDELSLRPNPLDALAELLEALDAATLAAPVPKRLRAAVAIGKQALGDGRNLQELLLAHVARVANRRFRDAF